MSACIGWPAEPDQPCPTFGPMHGCELPDVHPRQRHTCSCGANPPRPVSALAPRRLRATAAIPDVERALLPVGADCQCGFPLVWRNDRQWCAVYGSHRRIMLAADAELHGAPSDAPGKLGRRLKAVS